VSRVRRDHHEETRDASSEANATKVVGREAHRLVGPVPRVLIVVFFAVLGVLLSWGGADRLDLQGVTKTVAVMTAAAIVAEVVAARQLLVLTPTHLIVRSTAVTRSLPWSDILTIDERWGLLTVTATSGTYDVRLAAPMFGRVAFGRAVAQSVQQAWIERRGERWAIRRVDAWEPTLDVHERVVLRRRPSFGSGAFSFVVPFLVWSRVIQGFGALEPITANVGLLAVLAMAGVAFQAIAYARVVLLVTADEVVLRTLTHTRRFARADVLGAAVEEYAPPLSSAGSTSARRTVLYTAAGAIYAPAPASGALNIERDVRIYRKVAWLDAELRSA
jgi:hypothetical protein